MTELSEVLTKREAEADVKEREKRRAKLRGREATYSTLQKIASKEVTQLLPLPFSMAE